MGAKLFVLVLGVVFVLGVMLAGFGQAAAAAGGEQRESFVLHPIGTVHKRGSATTIKIKPTYQAGLQGLDGFSHVWVFWWFDRNDTPERRRTLQVHPRGNRDNPLTGVFATRSPVRPNLIAMTLCKIRKVEGNVVEVEDIDAFDNTPVVDLKPYIPGYDGDGKATVPDWIGRS